MAYLRCDEGTKLDGMLKLVVMDQCSPNGNIRTVSSPRVKECEKCKIQTVEPAVSTDSPLLLHAGLPRKYNLLWGAELAADDSDDQSGHSDTDCHSEVTEDMAGYACTPLTRAYDLFDQPTGDAASGGRRCDRKQIWHCVSTVCQNATTEW